jgi:hypothetical protein
MTNPGGRLSFSPLPAGWRVGSSAATVPLVGVACAALIGLAIATGPAGAIGAVLVLAIGAVVLLGARVVTVFLGALGVLLIAYAFLGRGVAHVGIGPVYIGEFVLALAVPTVLYSLRRAHISFVHVLLIAFMVWGAIRTVPYVGTYGIDALRDAVTWGYGFFAIAVSFALTPRALPVMVRAYRRLALPLVAWMPIAAVLTIVYGAVLPAAPGSDVPLIFFKAGDSGVHLAAVAAFVLLGLYGWGRTRAVLNEVVLWGAWLVSLGIVAAINRGGMVAASFAAFSGLFVRRLTRWLVPMGLGLLIVSAAWLVNPRVDLGIERTVSVDQLVQNVTSIFTSQGGTQTEATKEWRLAWWGKIVGYTIQGPYFWTGKGFGVNLAVQDGFTSVAESDLRAPHSTTFEVLARSGVPGLVLWILLQVAFAFTVLRAGFRARRAGNAALVAMLGWVFVYWSAALLNSSVDVYLDGPQGGIWFWAVIGLGLFLSRCAAEGTVVDLTDAAPSKSQTESVRGPLPASRQARRAGRVA